MKKLVVIIAVLLTACNQKQEQKTKIFRLYNNSRWYYPDSKSTITIPAGYYIIQDDTILCIQKDSIVENIVTVNKVK